MLSRQKKQFSEIFYVRYRNHVIYVVSKILILLCATGAAAGVSWYYILQGEGEDLPTSIFTVLFLWFGWSAYVSVPEILQVRLLPYFEQRVDGPDTWLAGESLLRHSRILDDAAEQVNVQPLSKFASGDDMVPFEQVCWFSSEEGLRTADRLTQPDVTASLPNEVISDLFKLRDALRIASDKGVKFCLLLREGTLAGGLEMDQRVGSFF